MISSRRSIRRGFLRFQHTLRAFDHVLNPRLNSILPCAVPLFYVDARPPCSATRTVRLPLSVYTHPHRPPRPPPSIGTGVCLQMTTTSRDTASNFSTGARRPERRRRRPGASAAGGAGLRGCRERVRASGIRLSESGECDRQLCESERGRVCLSVLVPVAVCRTSHRLLRASHRHALSHSRAWSRHLCVRAAHLPQG